MKLKTGLDERKTKEREAEWFDTVSKGVPTLEELINSPLKWDTASYEYITNLGKAKNLLKENNQLRNRIREQENTINLLMESVYKLKRNIRIMKKEANFIVELANTGKISEEITFEQHSFD